jgi:hypothetical protein
MEPKEFIALARACVPAELEAYSSAWRGVTFAPLRASAVLPHRAIFVLGLDAAAFPGTNEKGNWDLLSRNRIVGDPDTVKDNRFAFLELLHAAKEYLILSYKARDLQKDESLQPSSVISELEEYLMSRIKTDASRSAIRREIPWVVHESLKSASERGRKHGTWDKAQRELADASGLSRYKHRHELAKDRAGETRNGPQGNDSAIDSEIKNQYIADIRDLKIFLTNPLEYHLCRTLEIQEDDDDGDMAAVDEPLESDAMPSAQIRKDVWIAVLKTVFASGNNGADDIIAGGNGRASAEAVSCRSPLDTRPYIDEQELRLKAAEEADRIYSEHIDSGQAPEGYFRSMERKELLEFAEKCAAEAARLPEIFKNHKLIEDIEFEIDCSPFTVNWKLKQTLFPNDPKDRIGVLSFVSKDSVNDYCKLWLDGLAWWLEEDGARQVTLAALDRKEPKIQMFDMITGNEKLPSIEKWLCRVLSQMLIEKRSEHLPLKSIVDVMGIKTVTKIMKLSKDPEDVSFKERLQNLTFSALKDTVCRTFKKGVGLTDAAPPAMDDEELRELAGDRYAPILGRWDTWIISA